MKLAKGVKNKLDIKNFLKTIKLNESTISMILGAVVILVVGILVVNYFKKNETGDTLEVTEAQNAETSTTPKAGSKYIVKESDTLWSIAEDAYGTGFEWKKIQEANKLTNSQLEEGQELVIPQSSEKVTEEKTVAEKTVEKTTTVEKAITGETYTVVRGDNLWKIALNAYGDGYKWVDIAKVNKLDNPNLIHAGNVLVLPR